MYHPLNFEYDFWIHNSDSVQLDNLKIYIHMNVSPSIENLVNSISKDQKILIKYGITMLDHSLFSLTACVFSIHNDKDFILGNISFDTVVGSHKKFNLYENEIAENLSLKTVLGMQYYKKEKINHIQPSFTCNPIFSDHVLTFHFKKIFTYLYNFNLVPFDDYFNFLSIEVHFYQDNSYWQVCHQGKKERIYYSIPRFFDSSITERHLILALNDIDYVFRKEWFKNNMVEDIDRLMAITAHKIKEKEKL